MINFNLLMCIVVGAFFITPLTISTFSKNDTLKTVSHNILTTLFLTLLVILTMTETHIDGNQLIFKFSTTENLSKSFAINKLRFGTLDAKINLLMLIPVGALNQLKYSTKKYDKMSNKAKVVKGSLNALFLSVIIETMQLVLPINRTPDLNDIILNTISGLIGSSSCALVDYTKEKIENRIKNKNNAFIKEKTNIETNVSTNIYAKQNSLNVNVAKQLPSNAKLENTSYIIDNTGFEEIESTKKIVNFAKDKMEEVGKIIKDVGVNTTKSISNKISNKNNENNIIDNDLDNLVSQ